MDACVEFGVGIISIYDGKLADIPSSVVQITLAMGVTKITHRIAESNTDKIIDVVTSILKQKFVKGTRRK